uniref:C-type lectin domain-containing protein n=1 Tax=Sander lucioperca TaxID=283035 RepID=A0A8C9Z0X4_SANLU
MTRTAVLRGNTSATNPSPQCDLANGWTQHGSNCYNLKADTRKSWAAARHDCVQDGGDLVSIVTAEEEQYVTGSLDPSWIDLWIGLSTLVRGAYCGEYNVCYSWSDGTPLSHTNWGSGEPNNHEGREECVEMVSSSNGTYSWWNDLNCDSMSKAIYRQLQPTVN